ncbi:uncharacterized protein GLRG_10173 [Colletotrichum graminicola M1.001]|uniref:Uncharacterized protein n=1 Tax=Colletotrichum graminicola (strain M1.001 / M2 / FGSC 10212) TaxID=645133 RepID=E3QVZ1_COLGM|nr:uncharacterized protein GLRG_10173 [Colletotrichum graminicola M1.001]EFQ35029.1 hypothetical protein GLRG_10173 [Colletotrichum graminicola M1.001]
MKQAPSTEPLRKKDCPTLHRQYPSPKRPERQPVRLKGLSSSPRGGTITNSQPRTEEVSVEEPRVTPIQRPERRPRVKGGKIRKRYVPTALCAFGIS